MAVAVPPAAVPPTAEPGALDAVSEELVSAILAPDDAEEFVTLLKHGTSEIVATKATINSIDDHESSSDEEWGDPPAESAAAAAICWNSLLQQS